MFARITKKETKSLLKRIFSDLLVIIISVSVLYFALVAYAGSLIPSGGSSVPTMMSLEDIYNVLAGTNSVAATPKEDGNVMEILKCITTKIDGGVCS